MKTASVFLLLSVAAAYGALDLTPVLGERILDGIKFQQLSFNENGRAITYEQPRGWKYRAEAGRLVFTPPDLSQAEAAIEQFRLEASQAFDDATIKKLQDQVMRSAPAGSQHVELVSAEKNPLVVDRHDTFEVIVAYQISGTPFRRSVLFLNLSDTQVQFRVAARSVDFDKVHRAFRGSIYSWQWH